MKDGLEIAVPGIIVTLNAEKVVNLLIFSRHKCLMIDIATLCLISYIFALLILSFFDLIFTAKAWLL